MGLLGNQGNKNISSPRLSGKTAILSLKQGKWSAGMLALLFVVPVLGWGLVNASQSDTPLKNNQTPAMNQSQPEDLTEARQESTSRVEVKTETHAAGDASSQVTVEGSVSTTSEDGTTKTETFHKNYTSDSGDASNNFSINVNTSSDSNTQVKINEGSESEIDIDFDDDSMEVDFDVDD